VDHEAAPAPQLVEDVGQLLHQVLPVDAQHLAVGSGGIREGAEDVEDGPDADLLPGADGVLHGAVQRRGEEEADADLPDGVLHRLRSHVQVHAQGFQHVGAAAGGRYGPVAVLGHLHPAGRHHEGDRGGDVEGVGAVPPGAHHVQDRLLVDVDVVPVDVEDPLADPDRGGTVPHDPGRAGDLGHRLTLHPEGGDEGRDLGRGGLAGHDLVHDLDHFGFGEVDPLNYLGDCLLDHVVHL